jgi:glycolate oxidase
VPGNQVKRAASRIRREIGSDKVLTDPEALTCYAFDATNMRSLPSAVAFPETTDEIRAVMTLCRRFGLKVIPRGAGTGFAGGTVPLEGGVVVSTEKFNRILDIDVGQKAAVVQSGVVNAALQREAAKHGLMFPPDPSSLEIATIGGNVAQDAGGPRALKYGVTRNYVSGIEFITWEGSVVEPVDPLATGRLWDPLGTLMAGSEGTLGFMARIWLRLLEKPGAQRTVLAFFGDPVAAAAAVSMILASGVVPAAVELIDAVTMGCITQFVEVEIPRGAGCTLLIETDGRDGEAVDNMAVVEKVLEEARSIGYRTAASDRERDDLWKMRRSISPSLARLAPNKMNEDVCVPRSRLPVLVEAVGKLAEKYSLLVPTFGHAGDGNLHVNVMLDKRSRDEVRRAEALVTELFEVTMKLDGTISGEHGIGITKMQYLPDQLGPDGIRIQYGIKRAFDPESLINPGKVTGRS